MTNTLVDQQARTNAHDQEIRLKVYVSSTTRSQYYDMSQFYNGSNVGTGTGSNWIDITADIADSLTIDVGERTCRLSIRGWRWDSTREGRADPPLILVKMYAAASGNSSIADYPSKVLGLGSTLSAYYKLDTTADNSGRGHTLNTISGTSTVAGLVASGGLARTFNGSSDYMATGTYGAPTNSFTFGSWVSGSSGGIMEWAEAGYGSWDRSIWIDPSTGKLTGYIYPTFSGGIVGTTDIRGALHFAVMRIDTILNKTALFVDGVKQIESTGSAAFMGYSTPFLNVGRAKGTGSLMYYNGTLDDPFVFLSALTDGQILDLYNTGVDNGYRDIFVGYLGRGGAVTLLWQSNLFDQNAEGESAYLSKMLMRSGKYGPVNLAKGKTASMSSVLLTPSAEWPLERFTGGSCGPDKAVDGEPFDTVAIANTAPMLDGDYYSALAPGATRNADRNYVINEVFNGGETGPDVTIPAYVEIMPSLAAHYNRAGTRNLGNIQGYDATYMPGGNPGMVFFHDNGQAWSLVTSPVTLPFSPFPNNQQVLRSSQSGRITAGGKIILSPYLNANNEGTVIPMPGWNYRLVMWLRANLPTDNARHYLRYRALGTGNWTYLQLTGAWQQISVEADATTVNNPADSFWAFDFGAWTNSDSSGQNDASISYIDIARAQLYQGAPIKGEFNAYMEANYGSGDYGLGTLRLKVRNSAGALLQDVDLSRATTDTRTKGLQSIILSPSSAALTARFAQMSATEPKPIIIDTNDLFPGIWFDPSAPATTLNGAINNSVTTITVGGTAGFSATGTIQIDNEDITYTGTTGTTFTGCVRGAHGTTAASHLNAAPVGYQSTVASLELYSAAYTDVIRCDYPNDPGCQPNGQMLITHVPLKTHDILTLDKSARPATTSYGSYTDVFPSNANYSYQRKPGIFGSWAQNIYPSPGVPSMGSAREVLMVDLGTFVYAATNANMSTTDTQFEVDNPDHVPMNGIIKIDSEYMRVTALQSATVTVVRNVTVPSTPPVTGTLATHAAGANIIPMLPDALPATTWHQQTLNRVAGVVINRKDGMSAVHDATVMYATTAAAIPTAGGNWEYSTGWTLFRRISGNAATNIVLLAPGNTVGAPIYPPAQGFWDDPSLVGIEAREMCIIVNQMGYRPDRPTVRDRMKINEFQVIERPVNSGSQGNHQSGSGVNNLRDLFGYIWCGDYGTSISHPAAEMNARYKPSASFQLVGVPFSGDITFRQDSFSGAFDKLCSISGLDWKINRWCQLEVDFDRHSGLGIAPGQTPVFDFNQNNIRQASITQEVQHQCSQVRMSGKDYAGRTYQAVYPARPDKEGKPIEASGLIVLSQDALNRMCKARYNKENRDWTVVVTVGTCEWLQKGQLVTLNWAFDASGVTFTGEVFAVASWQYGFSQQSEVWQLQTTIKLEQRKLV